MKSILQLVGCVFIKEVQDNACWLVQLLGIGCVKKFGNIVYSAGITDTNTCNVPREYIGLAWDGVCFGFLILQRRIFSSYNFFHMIDESKAATILASRGMLYILKYIFIVSTKWRLFYYIFKEIFLFQIIFVMCKKYKLNLKVVFKILYNL